MLISLLVAILMIVSGFAVFFLVELFKKFGFMTKFINYPCTNTKMVTWDYPGRPWLTNQGRKTGMHTVVMRSRNGRPFAVLVGFMFPTPFIGPRFDHYGYAESDKNGVLIQSTYLGDSPAKFQYWTKADPLTEIDVSCTFDDQSLTPHVVYKPHWWQRLGVFG